MQRIYYTFILIVIFLPFCLNLSCYSCTFSFNDVYDIDNHNAWCTNKTLLKVSKDEVIKPCSAWEPWCITAITTTLNSFTSVTRACSVRCSTLCESIGYGQDQVTCADCCRSNNCNSNFSVGYYMDVMKRQHTSWTTPLQSERDFNKQRGIINIGYSLNIFNASFFRQFSISILITVISTNNFIFFNFKCYW